MSSLSPQMRELLDALRSGVRVIYSDGGMSLAADHYFRTDTMKSCTAQVRALMRRGLVEIQPSARGAGHSIIAKNSAS